MGSTTLEGIHTTQTTQTRQHNGKKHRSFKVAVKTKTNRDEWAYNELRFPSRASADRYGQNLEFRWSLLITYEVQGSSDPSNTDYPVPSDRYDVVRCYT